jgi:hypothetical protein
VSLLSQSSKLPVSIFFQLGRHRPKHLYNPASPHDVRPTRTRNEFFPRPVLLQSNSTYEASREGTLGRIAYELHVAEWGSELKSTMEHITYQPEYDRFHKSSIFAFFGIDESSVQFSKSQKMKLLWHALMITT